MIRRTQNQGKKYLKRGETRSKSHEHLKTDNQDINQTGEPSGKGGEGHPAIRKLEKDN